MSSVITNPNPNQKLIPSQNTLQGQKTSIAFKSSEQEWESWILTLPDSFYVGIAQSYFLNWDSLYNTEIKEMSFSKLPFPWSFPIDIAPNWFLN